MTPDQIKKLRNDLGLSVNDAALQVHVTARTWNRYESGERSIPEGVIELFFIKNELKYERK